VAYPAAATTRSACATTKIQVHSTYICIIHNHDRDYAQYITDKPNFNNRLKKGRKWTTFKPEFADRMPKKQGAIAKGYNQYDRYFHHPDYVQTILYMYIKTLLDNLSYTIVCIT
jgi:hypothetical protein